MLSEEQKKLVDENHNLIYHVIHKYNLPIEDYYDLLAIGLCKAAKSYKADVSKFATYAVFVMYNEVKQQYRVNTQSRRTGAVEISLDEVTGDTEFQWTDVLGYTDYKFRLVEILSDLKLNNQEQLVLKLYIQLGEGKKVAKVLGLSQSRTSKIICNIRDKIKEVL